MGAAGGGFGQTGQWHHWVRRTSLKPARSAVASIGALELDVHPGIRGEESSLAKYVSTPLRASTTRRCTVAVRPSGEQFEIRSGRHRATIVEVGGGVRSYDVGDRPVLHPYDVDAMCDAAHGAVLIPWPNRLADGKYRFGDRDLQLDLTEPAQHNAIHGLLRWRPWRASERRADRVMMTSRLYPMTGYPFALEVDVDYSVGDDGLVVRTTATNIGDQACPYGAGQHPYLSPGDGLIDDCTLTLPAATRVLTDDRQLPAGREPVDGTPFDFRGGRELGDAELDFAFADLLRGSDGQATVELRGTDGRTAQLWLDDTYALIQAFTADTLAPDRRRRGFGVEPMTCPPDAFNSGDDLIVLAPGDSATSVWGARLS